MQKNIPARAFDYGAATKVLLLLAASVASATTWASAAEPETLVIHAVGFSHERGQAIASLFYQSDDVFKTPRARATANIQHGQALLNFPNLAPGDYAVVVFHDENGNADLDHNFMRFPVEPLGYSNHFELTLFSGLPSFAKLRFSFDAGAGPVEIQVK